MIKCAPPSCRRAMEANTTENEETSLAEALLSDLRQLSACGIDTTVVTHVAVDADAILGTALTAIAVPGVRVEFGSSDDAIGPERTDTMGVDICAGARSIKGRDSSAAEVIANAMENLGWVFDEELRQLIHEVTAIDSAKGRKRTFLNFGTLCRSLRDAGWSDLQIIEHTAECIEAQLVDPLEVSQ